MFVAVKENILETVLVVYASSWSWPPFASLYQNIMAKVKTTNSHDYKIIGPKISMNVQALKQTSATVMRFVQRRKNLFLSLF